MDKRKLRESIFRHLDGIVRAPVISALSKKKVLDFILANDNLELSELNEKFDSNEGYLNVALRVLASQGFIDYELDNQSDIIKISVNSKTKDAFSHQNIYVDLAEFLADYDVINSKELTENLCKKWIKLFLTLNTRSFYLNFFILYKNSSDEKNSFTFFTRFVVQYS